MVMRNFHAIFCLVTAAWVRNASARQQLVFAASKSQPRPPAERYVSAHSTTPHRSTSPQRSDRLAIRCLDLPPSIALARECVTVQATCCGAPDASPSGRDDWPVAPESQLTVMEGRHLCYLHTSTTLSTNHFKGLDLLIEADESGTGTPTSAVPALRFRPAFLCARRPLLQPIEGEQASAVYCLARTLESAAFRARRPDPYRLQVKMSLNSLAFQPPAPRFAMQPAGAFLRQRASASEPNDAASAPNCEASAPNELLELQSFEQELLALAKLQHVAGHLQPTAAVESDAGAAFLASIRRGLEDLAAQVDEDEDDDDEEEDEDDEDDEEGYYKPAGSAFYYVPGEKPAASVASLDLSNTSTASASSGSFASARPPSACASPVLRSDEELMFELEM